MDGFAEELVDESIGGSSKKWALVLFCLVAGAGIALWLRNRSGRGELPVDVASEGAATYGSDTAPKPATADETRARFSRQALANKLRHRRDASPEPATAID